MPASAPERPAAVVADVGWVNGLAAIRSLGRNGVRALAVDHRPWALGFRSRYATPVAAPDPGPVGCGRGAAPRGAAPARAAGGAGSAAARPGGGEPRAAAAPASPPHDEHVTVPPRRSADIGAVFRPCTPEWDVLE